MTYDKLNQTNGYIWRIIHKDNLPWLLANGLHCKNSAIQAPDFKAIGNAELIDRRAMRAVPIAPGGMLSDYIPFYFTPFSPMMYNIYTGRGVPQRRNDEICILVSSLPRLLERRVQFIFTDSHAYPPLVRYYNDIANLGEVDWPLLQARNFKRNPDDPAQMDRYQAEALVYRSMPIEALLGVICYTETMKTQVQQQIHAHGLNLAVHAMPGWYF